AVRAALHVNSLDRFKGLGIPHDDRAAAAEAVVGLGIHRDAARSSVGDRSDRLERVEIKNQNLAASRNVKAAVIAIRKDIVNPACAHSLDGVDDLVWFGGWSCLSEGHRSERDQAAQGHRARKN